MSVVPASSTRSTPAGAFTRAAGPAATIRSPRTSTTQPSWGTSAVPSQTALGTNRRAVPVSAGGADWASPGPATQTTATLSVTAVFNTSMPGILSLVSSSPNLDAPGNPP